MKLIFIPFFAFVATTVASSGSLNARPNLVQLAQQLNLTTLVKALKETGLDHVINHEGKFTIFAPTDEAFAHEKKYPGEASLKEKITFHIARGLYQAKDVVDEVTVKTLLSDRTIRFNIYPNKQVTANGRPIVSTDHEAHNGVIHIISDVMSSVYHLEGSVISELDECCPQHSTLLELVKVAGLFNTLDTEGPFTFFAPLDSGFAKLHPDFIIHLKKNMTALRGLLLNHIVPLTWYSPGFVDGQTVKNVMGKNLNVKVGKDGTIQIGKATVSLGDITAANGVIHSISDVIFPKRINNVQLEMANQIAESEKRKNLVEALNTFGFSSFAKALVSTGLDKVVENSISSGSRFTVLAPSNHAFDNPHKYQKPFDLEEKLRMHLVPNVVLDASSFVETGTTTQFDTLLDGRFINVNVLGPPQHKKRIFGNGKEFQMLSKEKFLGGVIIPLASGSMDYIYDPMGTVSHEMSKFSEYEKFYNFVKESGIDGVLNDPNYNYTVLVLKNDVYAEVEKKMEKYELFSKLLLNHVFDSSWYSQEMDVRQFVTSLGGRKNFTKKSKAPMVGNARIMENEILGVNGVIFEVNGLV